MVPVEVRTQPHVSFTQIDQYLRCPLRYRFLYIDRLEPDFVPAARAFGSGIHAAAAVFFRGVGQGERPSVADVQGYFEALWKLEGERRPLRFGERETKESLLDLGRRMLAVLCEQFNPRTEVVAGRAAVLRAARRSGDGRGAGPRSRRDARSAGARRRGAGGRGPQDVGAEVEHRLFLSATPHNGHSNSFSALLEILDPQRFCRGVPVEGAKQLDPIMVRRLKDDLRRLQGGFPKREIVEIPIAGLNADDPELLLPRLLDEYREAREARLKTAPKSVQNAAAINNFDSALKATVITASHHGASTFASNSQDWATAMAPEVLISSAGNRFFHPRCAATNRFNSLATTKTHDVRVAVPRRTHHREPIAHTM